MKISLQKLTTKDLSTLCSRVISYSKKAINIEILKNPLLRELENIYTEYDKVYAKVTFSGKGKSVAQADKARDKAFAKLKNYLAGYAQMDTLPHFEEAKVLYEIFKTYGLNIDRLSYSAGTAQLSKLIENLSTSENQERIQKIGVEKAFEEMKKMQSDFENVFAEQTQANSELRQMQSATKLRKELEQILRTYFEYVKTMKKLKDWDDLYNDFNELIKSAKNSTVTINEKTETSKTQTQVAS